MQGLNGDSYPPSQVSFRTPLLLLFFSSYFFPSLLYTSSANFSLVVSNRSFPMLSLRCTSPSTPFIKFSSRLLLFSCSPLLYACSASSAFQLSSSADVHFLKGGVLASHDGPWLQWQFINESDVQPSGDTGKNLIRLTGLYLLLWGTPSKWEGQGR